MDTYLLMALPLPIGYGLDLLLADPEGWPHPVRAYGWLIGRGERALNRGRFRFWKGALLASSLCAAVFAFFCYLQAFLISLHPYAAVAFNSLMVFYGLANQGLIREGQNVFRVLQEAGLEAGRRQLSRIVGRNTGELSAQQVRIGALESMSENLSDGIIAPLFWYALAGVPGMMTYKLINTLDSMIGYRNERYEQFGKFAARLDDLVNWLPARLTVLLMALSALNVHSLTFAFRYGNRHKSPNSGYPEAALAGILDCRFGGPNRYGGKWVDKPYIGENDRLIADEEIRRVVRINHLSCLSMVMAVLLFLYTLR
jgi:adenosylcobinamide-phosphate synthase